MFDKRAKNLLHEERIAFSFLIDRLRKGLGKGMSRKFAVQERVDVFLRKEVESHFLIQASRLKIKPDLRKRMFRKHQIFRPVCRNDQDFHRPEFRGEVCQQVYRGVVGPMQIVQEQN